MANALSKEHVQSAAFKVSVGNQSQVLPRLNLFKYLQNRQSGYFCPFSDQVDMVAIVNRVTYLIS